MSAIEPLGYPDWQRLTNWDGPVLWEPAPGVYNAQLNGPVMRVDRYQALSCLLEITAGKASFTFAWYADQALTTLIAARQVYLDGGAGNTSIVRLTNLGAWCQVLITPIGGAAFTLASTVFAVTNRGFPSEYVAISSMLAQVESQNINAGVTFTAQCQYVVAGRAHLWAAGPTAGATVDVLAMLLSGVYVHIYEGVLDGNGELNDDLELPQSSIKLQISNTTGVAHNYFAALVSNGR